MRAYFLAPSLVAAVALLAACNKAPETAAPGSPTVILTGHPLSGYIKIRQRRRRR